MTELVMTKRLEPYVKIAQDVAKTSPCERRQYGALLASTKTMYWVAKSNERVSNCCNGYCARNRVRLRNGERVEVGAEVHAETAALIAYTDSDLSKSVLVLVGYAGERELLSEDVYPCHTCALNLKYAGIRWVYLKDRNQEISPVLLSEIIEYREAEWVPDV